MPCQKFFNIDDTGIFYLCNLQAQVRNVLCMQEKLSTRKAFFLLHLFCGQTRSLKLIQAVKKRGKVRVQNFIEKSDRRRENKGENGMMQLQRGAKLCSNGRDCLNRLLQVMRAISTTFFKGDRPRE